MPKFNIPEVSGRRFKKENIDITKTINFDIPPRDPGRIPSLPRPLSKPKSTEPLLHVPPQNMKLQIEQELAVASTRPIPARPLPPAQVPHTKSKEEKVSSLSELIV